LFLVSSGLDDALLTSGNIPVPARERDAAFRKCLRDFMLVEFWMTVKAFKVGKIA
jgi:hypothetical protein